MPLMEVRYTMQTHWVNSFYSAILPMEVRNTMQTHWANSFTVQWPNDPPLPIGAHSS